MMIHPHITTSTPTAPLLMMPPCATTACSLPLPRRAASPAAGSQGRPPLLLSRRRSTASCSRLQRAQLLQARASLQPSQQQPDDDGPLSRQELRDAGRLAAPLLSKRPLDLGAFSESSLVAYPELLDEIVSLHSSWRGPCALLRYYCSPMGVTTNTARWHCRPALSSQCAPQAHPACASAGVVQGSERIRRRGVKLRAGVRRAKPRGAQCLPPLGGQLRLPHSKRGGQVGSLLMHPLTRGDSEVSSLSPLAEEVSPCLLHALSCSDERVQYNACLQVHAGSCRALELAYGGRIKAEPAAVRTHRRGGPSEGTVPRYTGS